MPQLELISQETNYILDKDFEVKVREIGETRIIELTSIKTKSQINYQLSRSHNLGIILDIIRDQNYLIKKYNQGLTDFWETIENLCLHNDYAGLHALQALSGSKGLENYGDVYALLEQTFLSRNGLDLIFQMEAYKKWENIF